jgi:hypothetical protein
MRSDGPASWESYLESREFPVDTAAYCSEDGSVLVNRIYRYEELGAAVRDIEEKIGCSVGPMTVREKSGFRIKTPTFAEVMADARQKQLIMDAFASSLRITPYD